MIPKLRDKAPLLTVHPSFTVVPKGPTAEQQAEHIATLCRELYKTNDGPRLLEQAMREFPYPRGPHSRSSHTAMCHNLG